MLNGNNDLTEKRICHECVGESYLSAEIRQAADVAKCAYCDESAPSITLNDLADHIETAFDAHYIRTSDQSDEWGRDGYPVVDAIADAAQIEDVAAKDVLSILEDRHANYDHDTMGEGSEFDRNSYYAEKGPDAREWEAEWWAFEKSLKTEARFFNSLAANLLREVFDHVDELKTRDGSPPVIAIGPGTKFDHLYRARVFQGDSALEEALRRPDMHLGSPPSKLARAGRMNATGVSVFYGATETSVAIAEVRAPVGSNVAVAKFNITRALRLLDLTVLDHVHTEGSIFDPSWTIDLERAAFLRTLGSRMARPVMPDDEAVDYLPTQAVADFLATTNEPRLDGIVFSSAQTDDGCNVVLFHEAAKVAEAELPEGTYISASLGQWSDDEWESDYCVIERVPPKRAPEQPAEDNDIFGLFDSSIMQPKWDEDCRQATLEIEFDSVIVHYVKSVDVKTVSFPVRRHRIEARDPKF